MDQRISFVTLAVADMAATRRFYIDGLGWSPEHDDDEVIMLMAGDHLVLSLWARASFEEEIGGATASGGVPPIALAHNVRTRGEVDEVLDLVRGLGAQVTEPQERVWGGYTGYFADPDGYRWEVAWNPGSIGQAVLP